MIRDKFTDKVGGPDRMGVCLKMPDAAQYFFLANNKNSNAAVKEIEKLLCGLNDDWNRRCGEFMKEAA